MALESLTGSVYVNALNSSWPLGSDPRSQGDDHLRGIKNVLKNSFPSISGPVTRTHTSLSNGSVPSGSKLVFHQASAPTGWTRVADINNTYMLRVVATASAGGGSGGSHDPILNNLVPAHTHTFSGTSGGHSNDHTHGYSATTNTNGAAHTHTFSGWSSEQALDHTHTGTTSLNGDHSHSQDVRVSTQARASGGGGAFWEGVQGGSTGTTGAHSHSFTTSLASYNLNHSHSYSGTTNSNGATHSHTVSGTTSGASATHTHAYSGTTASNTSASSWQPRYLDVILCVRS